MKVSERSVDETQQSSGSLEPSDHKTNIQYKVYQRKTDSAKPADYK